MMFCLVGFDVAGRTNPARNRALDCTNIIAFPELTFMLAEQMRNAALASGIFGLTGVFMGAFGAHALKTTLAARGTHDVWETGVFYQLIHAATLLGVAAWNERAATPAIPLARNWLAWAARCWALGILLFSGSLYALALGGPAGLLGPVTPLGGLALLAGWACVIAQALTATAPAEKS
jgi:uncharacterized membrane protein YgdD (TMEM256/DUF423 family)